MVHEDAPRSGRPFPWMKILRGLLFYALVPALLLVYLARPAGEAVRLSGASAWWILAAALGAVCLNWAVYAAIHRKRPPLPVFAHGAFCLLALLVVACEALPNDAPLRSGMTVIGVSLAMLGLLLVSFWLASFRKKPALAASVLIRVILGAVLCGMAYQIIWDMECRNVTADTWITFGVLVAFILGFNARKIYAAVCRAVSRRRRKGLATGQIVQIIGETSLDLDGDPVTQKIVRVQYEAGGAFYETRTAISGYAVRKFGREAFIGREVPVSYDPENPADAYTDRIDRHFFDQDREEDAEA